MDAVLVGHSGNIVADHRFDGFSLFTEEFEGRARRYMDYLPNGDPSRKPLDELEYEFKRCDLIYHYAEKFVFGSEPEQREILMVKNDISAAIMDKLSEGKLRVKTCKVCGRTLPFNFRFGICDGCHRRRVSRAAR